MPDAPADQPADQPVPLLPEPPAQPERAPDVPVPPGAYPGPPNPGYAPGPGYPPGAGYPPNPGYPPSPGYPSGPGNPPGAGYPPNPGYPSGWPRAGAPPFAGYQYPGMGAPAPKRSRLGLIVTVVVAVVAVGCLGAGTAVFFLVRNVSDHVVSADPAGLPTDFPTDLPTDEPTDDPTTDPGDPSSVVHAGDIKRFVLARPAGAHDWPHAKADQAITLTTATVDFGLPKESQDDLQEDGFKDGYVRRWVDGHGDRVLVRVFRFDDPDDPDAGEEFGDFDIEADQDAGWGATRDVPEVPQGAAFVKPTREKDGYQEALAVYSFADISVTILTEQPPPASATLPDKLMGQEYHLL